MGISQKIIHNSIMLLNSSKKISFERDFQNIEEVQRKRLSSYLESFSHLWPRVKNYEEFSKEFPVTNYTYWEEKINLQRGGKKDFFPNCKRFQPTSGSSQKKKWIPYTKSFLSEYNQALGPWIFDIYKNYPRVRSGYHYFTLSWQPEEMRRAGEINNDLEYLSKSSEYFFSLVQAVPSSIAEAKTSEASLFATITWLVARKELSFLFLWSPTFGLTILELLEKYKDAIAKSIKYGKWELFSHELKGIACPYDAMRAEVFIQASNLKTLWPGLSLVSCWQSALSKSWYEKLKKKLSFCEFVENGLVATEGVVTFPYQGKLPLAYKSHFYEFRNIKTKKIYPAWDLGKGERYEVLLTSGNGIFRYNLEDRVEVVDYIENCPCFKFLGRENSIDFVGEKISSELAQELITSFQESFDGLTALCLLGIQPIKGKPFYVLLVEGRTHLSDAVINWLERELDELHHYKLARELHQLDAPRVFSSWEMRENFVKWRKKQGMLEGDIKMDPLVKMIGDDWRDFIHE